jgi:glycerol-3-phosphate acyltransferase PlsY
VETVAYVTVAFAAYLLGSIPTGYLVGKARGLDIRTVGSGNIGATNVFRAIGKPAGCFVLFADALKGYLACTVLIRSVVEILGPASSPQFKEVLSLIGGIAAILGHNYTCWLQFKGGKGIATSAGVLLALVPFGLMVSFLTWVVVFALSKYVSLASIASAVVLPFGVWLTPGGGADPKMIVVTAFLSVLAIYKHKANIQRLLNGTEHRFGSKKSSPSPQSTQ